MSEAKTPKPLSECSPDELRARGFKLPRVRSYPNAPLREQIRHAKTERAVRELLLVVSLSPKVSSGTVRKCERAAAERIRELYAEAAALITIPEGA
jgi:hypothetical protein